MSPTTGAASAAPTSHASNSLLLSKGVSRLEITLKLTTAILALAAGVYTYLGVRELLNGSPTMVFFAAVIYSVAVSVGIYAFWIFLMQFMPHVVDRTGRALMFGCMLLGSLMIVAMSSWLNASALAGAPRSSSIWRSPCRTIPAISTSANTNAIAAQGLLPDIQLASARFSKLADAERAGSLTGTAGSGTVVQLLTQMSGQLDSLGQEVQASGKRVSGTVRTGRQESREDARADLRPRTDRGAQRRIRVGVAGADGRDRQSAADLGGACREARGGFADIGLHRAGRRRPTADLAERQTAVVGKVESSIAAQAASLRRPPTRSWRCRASSRHGSSRCRPPKRAALCRRLHSELGRRDLDRPDAGGAGADPVRRACRDPARRASGSQRIRHDGGRTGRGDADGARGCGSATDSAVEEIETAPDARTRRGIRGIGRERHRAVGGAANQIAPRHAGYLATVSARVHDFLADNPDEAMLRWLFPQCRHGDGHRARGSISPA